MRFIWIFNEPPFEACERVLTALQTLNHRTLRYATPETPPHWGGGGGGGGWLLVHWGGVGFACGPLWRANCPVSRCRVYPSWCGRNAGVTGCRARVRWRRAGCSIRPCTRSATTWRPSSTTASRWSSSRTNEARNDCGRNAAETTNPLGTPSCFTSPRRTSATETRVRARWGLRVASVMCRRRESTVANFCAVAGATISSKRRSPATVTAGSSGAVRWSATNAGTWWTYTRANERPGQRSSPWSHAQSIPIGVDRLTMHAKEKKVKSQLNIRIAGSVCGWYFLLALTRCEHTGQRRKFVGVASVGRPSSLWRHFRLSSSLSLVSLRCRRRHFRWPACFLFAISPSSWWRFSRGRIRTADVFEIFFLSFFRTRRMKSLTNC